MEGVGVNGRQADGNYSFAVYADTGAYAVSRALSNSLYSGTFDITVRFDLTGSGSNLVSLRSGNNTNTFGGGELLSFLASSMAAYAESYADSSGLHALALRAMPAAWSGTGMSILTG